jgi:peroxiredoxin
VFIFDAERKLRYTGRIDDGEVKEPKNLDARNAIDALLANKPVPVEKTKVFGCSTKWAEKSGDAEKSIAKWNAEPVELADIDVQAVQKLVKDNEKTLVINVWATWCAPCTRELPEFVTMNRMYRKRNFQLITISLDEKENRAKALEQLKELHVAATNYIFAGDNRDRMMEALDAKWEGPVPHTIVIAPGGKIVYRSTGQIDPLEVKRAVVSQIGRTYASDKK